MSSTPNPPNKKLQLLFVKREFNKCLSASLHLLIQKTSGDDNATQLNFSPVKVEEEDLLSMLQKASPMDHNVSLEKQQISALIFQCLFELNHSILALKVFPVLFGSNQGDKNDWVTQTPSNLVLLHIQLLGYLNNFEEAEQILSIAKTADHAPKSVLQKMKQYVKQFPEMREALEQEKAAAKEQQEMEQQIHEQEKRFADALKSQFSQQEVLQDFFHQDGGFSDSVRAQNQIPSQQHKPEIRGVTGSNNSGQSPPTSNSTTTTTTTTAQLLWGQLYHILQYIVSIMKPYRQGLIVAFVAAVLYLVFLKGAAAAASDAASPLGSHVISPIYNAQQRVLRSVKDMLRMGFSPYGM